MSDIDFSDLRQFIISLIIIKICILLGDYYVSKKNWIKGKIQYE